MVYLLHSENLQHLVIYKSWYYIIIHKGKYKEKKYHVWKPLVKGMLQEYWKMDMFLETFRLLVCAISNFVWSPYKDFLTLDLGTW